MKIINETIVHMIVLLLLAVLFYLNYKFNWGNWIKWTLIGITIIIILEMIWSIFIQPFLLYRYWRYRVDAEFLQLKSGALNEVHELIPMTKVQSVQTNQGPILRRYGLYSLSIETMGSTHAIPALSKEIAIELRNEIARFAKIKEVGE